VLLEPVPFPVIVILVVPVFVDFPFAPPTLITVPPALLVPTVPVPARLPAEFVFDVPAPDVPVIAVVPLPPVVASPAPPVATSTNDVPSCASELVLLKKFVWPPELSVAADVAVPLVAAAVAAPEPVEFEVAPFVPASTLFDPTVAV